MKKANVNGNDRRTRYTRSAIKDALLQLLAETRFEKITVTEICRRSEINRGTFYLHYCDTCDALDDLIDDAFSDTSDIIDHVICPHRAACTYPMCEKIHASPKYHPLFLDDAAAARILKKISEACEERFVTYLMQNSTLTFEQVEAIFHFQINGCLTINQMMLKNRCTDWRKVQDAIDQYIKTGLTSHLIDNGRQPTPPETSEPRAPA